ncbi:hypothetical protein [Kitasatospora sp. McL0602]|uniref:hypothetical protein n=1 Tax=Kitasatospora sp. McL0602 TaxID=3439530 RepID=UPI003F8A5100
MQKSDSPISDGAGAAGARADSGVPAGAGDAPDLLGRPETRTARALRRAAVTLLVLTLTLALAHLHDPRPVYGPLVLLGLASAAGLGWSIAVRARVVEVGEGRPGAHPVGTPRPPARLPLPRPGAGWRHRVYLATLLLLAFAVLATLPSNGVDRRYRAFQRAGAAVTQGRIARPPEQQKTVDHASGKGRHDRHSTAALTVDLPDGHGGHEHVRVPDASADTVFHQGDAVTVLYAPGAPGLGGVVDDSEDLAAYLPGLLRPPAVPVLALLGVYAFLMLGWISTAVSHRGRAKAKVIRDDCAAGPLPAARAEVVAAVRRDTTGPGSRPGTAAVSSEHWLELRCEGRAVELYLTDPHAAPYLAARLRGRPGWLLAAKRWRLIKDNQPLAFVTDDGEVVWGETRSWAPGFAGTFGEHRRRTDPGLRPTDPTRTARLAPRVVHPAWTTDGAAAVLLALTALAVAPTLATADGPFDHPFCYGAPLLSAALAAHALGWHRRIRRLPWTVRAVTP